MSHSPQLHVGAEQSNAYHSHYEEEATPSGLSVDKVSSIQLILCTGQIHLRRGKILV